MQVWWFKPLTSKKRRNLFLFCFGFLKRKRGGLLQTDMGVGKGLTLGGFKYNYTNQIISSREYIHSIIYAFGNPTARFHDKGFQSSSANTLKQANPLPSLNHCTFSNSTLSPSRISSPTPLCSISTPVIDLSALVFLHLSLTFKAFRVKCFSLSLWGDRSVTIGPACCINFTDKSRSYTS